MGNEDNSKNGRPVIDITGTIYKYLLVLGRDLDPNLKRPHWICLCDCGQIRSINGSNLRKGVATHCGNQYHRQLRNLTGQVFGRLTVIGEAPRIKKYGRRWLVRCSCPNKTEKIIADGLLTSGHVSSCSCYRKEEATKNATKHGLRFTPEYYIWREMVSRMTNPNNPGFKNYGGRGLLLDPDFLTFQGFISHIGRRPSKELTLERLRNSEGYIRNNVIWASRTDQANNTRGNVLMTLGGVTHTMKQWSELLGMNYGTLRERKKVLLWSDEKSLTTPTRFITKRYSFVDSPLYPSKKLDD